MTHSRKHHLKIYVGPDGLAADVVHHQRARIVISPLVHENTPIFVRGADPDNLWHDKRVLTVGMLRALPEIPQPKIPPPPPKEKKPAVQAKSQGHRAPALTQPRLARRVG